MQGLIKDFAFNCGVGYQHGVLFSPFCPSSLPSSPFSFLPCRETAPQLQLEIWEAL